MAHIASCMVDAESDGASLNPYIQKPASPQPPNESLATTASEKQSFVWRMHHPEIRKYQLFPKDKRLPPISSGKGLDPEQAFALAMGQTGEKSEKTTASSGLRLRINQHNLTRRRKVSVPELGPMTTVQEVAMDSPTIPGRPPLHERSISAPGGNSWKQHQLVDGMTSLSPITQNETAELVTSPSGALAPAPTPSPATEAQRIAFALPRQPLSPKQLAPLVIPPQHGSIPRLTRQVSLTRLRSGSTPVEPTLRSARTDDSPKLRTPYTPLSAASTALTTPRSASTAPPMSATTLPTPVSASIVESRASPKPWEGRPTVATTPKEPITAATPSTLTTPMLERAGTPKTEELPQRSAILGHRRGQSESGSIMERGRPRKRTDMYGNNGPLLKRSDSKRSKSAERRAFEQLPQGYRVADAITNMNPIELDALQKQAIGQAARFEVLRKEDVDALSRELRHLDERTEYLRRTYTSLRAGRRNLHSRICQYLRSPRVAKFSHDSMLKQEEALAELDASIDDWVSKLEHAENRRTRVRQKLLEHVAAACTLPTGAAAAASESLQLAMGIRSPPPSIGVGNISTPPRSPTKTTFTPAPHTSSSPSPQRATAASVPSTILEQPLFEEAAAIDMELPQVEMISMADAMSRRSDAMSIRVYADSDVYALLADVENQITKMSSGAIEASSPVPPVPALPALDLALNSPLSEDEQRELHRARSHELLSGLSSKAGTPVPPSPPLKESSTSSVPADGETFFLTSAVFRPEKSVPA